MVPIVHWIEAPPPGRLAIVPRPRAGEWLDDEIAGWRTAGIDLVVSLLESGEAAELGLHREADLCDENRIEFVSFPVPDRGVPPSWPAASDLARLLTSRLSQGRTVAVHCRAGIGRSSVIAARVLVRLGANSDRAFETIARARGVEVPDTEEQREWVRAFAGRVRSGSRPS